MRSAGPALKLLSASIIFFIVASQMLLGSYKQEHRYQRIYLLLIPGNGYVALYLFLEVPCNY